MPDFNRIDTRINTLFVIVQQLLELFHRHQQGTNVSASLVELQSKVRSLLAEELAIANAPVVLTDANATGTGPVGQTEGDN